MFGKLTLEQKKFIQAILLKSGLILSLHNRAMMLESAGLGVLTSRLPIAEDSAIFAGALVRECERIGAPPSLGEYATVKLALYLRSLPEVQNLPNAVDQLTE